MNTENEIVKVDENGDVAELDDIVDGMMIITLKKPIIFEKKEYKKIDLTEMENLKAADMIAVSRILNRKGNVDFLQEMTLEYAINLAARGTGLPIEFFEQLPPWAAMQVKNRVTGFLYRQG